MIKVLQVISSINPEHGGVTQAVINFHHGFEALGVKSTILSLDDPGEEFLIKLGIEIIALGAAQSGWAYSENLKSWLIANLSKFDIVIVHGLWLYHSFAVTNSIRVLKKLDKKVPAYFIMPHGMLDPYFQKDKSRRKKAVRNWIYWKVIEERNIRQADCILFTCETEMLLAATTFTPYRPKQTENIGLGVLEPPAYTNEMQRAFENKTSYKTSNPYLLFLSRIHSKKGLDILLHAYEHFLRANQEQTNVPCLVVAGPGIDTAFGQQCVQHVNTSPHLKDKVFFVGMLSGEAKWGAIYCSKAFVLPSHQENFGIAVVEALACKIPVLISNQVNIYKEIEIDKGGIIAGNNEEAVYDQLTSFLKLSDAEVNKMGENARRSYESRFTIDVVSQKAVQLIERMIHYTKESIAS